MKYYDVYSKFIDNIDQSKRHFLNSEKLNQKPQVIQNITFSIRENTLLCISEVDGHVELLN